MHKFFDNIIIVNWKNDFGIHIEDDETCGLISDLTHWNIISSMYVLIGEL
jgi:hypothetical protein